MGHNSELQAEALSIWSLVAMLGSDRAHRIRTPAPGDGIGRTAGGFMILDLPETHG
jgi:hypothetical protein